MARVNTKTIHTIRYVYVTAMTMLLINVTKKLSVLCCVAASGPIATYK